jgi:hypothetical protein
MRVSPRSDRRVDWMSLSLDVSMSAGWAFLVVLIALVLLDLLASVSLRQQAGYLEFGWLPA